MRILLLAGLLTLACPLAQATTVVYKDLQDLAGEADGIVAGTVTDVQARYGQDRRIYTLVKLQDLQVIAGNYGRSELYVSLLGGEVQGDVLDVHGSPQFAVGDQVMLFLQGNGKQIVPFVGWTQGVFRIEDVNGREIITDSDGNRVLGVRGDTIIKENRTASRADIIGDPQSQAERYQATGSAMSTGRSAPGQGNAGSGDGETEEVGIETKAQPEAAFTREQFVAAIKSKARARTRAAIQSADVATFAEDAGPAKAAPPPGGSELRTAPDQDTGDVFLPQRPENPGPVADE